MSNVIYCKEHKYIHLDTTYKSKYTSNGDVIYTRIDRYYCERCLDEKEMIKREVVKEGSRDIPVWYVKNGGGR